MKISITNELQITGAPEPMLKKIRTTFTLRNPAYDAAVKMGRWLGNLEEYLYLYSERAGAVTIPRGAISLILTNCRDMSIRPEINDKRRTLPEVDFHFTGQLKGYQQSATPFRNDGLTKLIGWHLGRQVEVKESELTDKDIIQNVEVITRETHFNPYCDASEQYPKMLSELTEDKGRNGLIVRDIIKEASNGGGVCLVLSDRKAHCEDMRALLFDSGIKVDVLTGETGNKEREAIVGRLSAGTVKILIATGQLIGEGFDAKSLQTLFLATPIKFDGRLIQYLGRVLRPAPGKTKARIYDYVDVNVGVLKASAKSRQGVYARLNQR